LSFIEKALKRAKALHQEREKPISPPEENLPPIPKERGGAGHPVPSEAFPITLTRTAVVDAETMRRHRLITAENEGTWGEDYKLLRTNILQRTRGNGPNAIMFTGPSPDEGKTLTIINLALAISKDMEQTVLLVDADLRSPSIHRYFGLPPGPGLADYLLAGVPIQEILVHPSGFDRLAILPGSRPVSQAAELMSSSLMAELVQELKHAYPDCYILFDSPPLMTYTDALAFAPLIDAIVLVVEAGKTPKEEIARSLEVLKEFTVLGFVLNKTEKVSTSYYYKDNKDGKRDSGLLGLSKNVRRILWPH
jgi:protein-tyrosine kinase